MGTKHPKIDPIVWSLEEVSGQAKSYTCSFCRKGFANAQALGGHMNIHRKDRAKLRESSEENTVPLDIMKMTTTTNPSDHDVGQSQVSGIILDSSEEKSSSPRKRPCKVSKEDDGASASVSPSPRSKDANIEEVKQLSLFVEGSSQMELDLELRLGTEPHQETSSKSTREFFR
ncbi:hypothetical protein PTKIN_Ptkin13bG0285200 [Pterospermum kingtungense]